MGTWTPGPGATGGNDTYQGDSTNENVDGLGGNDTLYGRGGGDVLTGGEGDDRIAPGNDSLADTVSGGNGYDILDYSEITEDGVNIYTWDNAVFRNSTPDTISGFEEYIGTATGDVINVQSGGVLRGGAGNDILFGSNSQMYGGAGRDFFAVFDGPNTIHDFQVGVDFFTNSNVTSMAIDGADTLLTFFNGTVFRIIGINNVALVDWQAHATSGWGINSGANNDTFTGFAVAEYFWGGEGNDTIDAGGGHDTVYGGTGNDVLTGGAGNDLVDGGSGDDLIHVTELSSGDTYIGGSGTDTIRVQSAGEYQEFLLLTNSVTGVERLEFGSTIGTGVAVRVSNTQMGSGFSNTMQITGSALNDTFFVEMTFGPGSVSLGGLTFVNWNENNDLVMFSGSAGNDTVVGSTVRDWFFGQDGNDTISGNGGDDDLRGGLGADSLSGNNGNDALYGDDGTDTLLGQDGDDFLEGGAGVDTLGGGAGVDTASYFLSSAGVTIDLQAGTGVGGDAQGDTLTGIERIFGSNLNDVLSGRDYVNNTFYGYDGDDVLMGRYGADNLDGGNGIDTVSYQNSLTAVDVRLFNNTAAGGEANGDQIFNVENVRGSGLTDVLAGNHLSNQMWGGAGNETITGREADDYLLGEQGNDTLLGGAGSDYLIGGAGADTLGGGVDDDAVDYSLSGAGVTVNLATGAGTGGDAQGDTFVSIEDVFGSNFNDVIIGKANFWDNIFDGRGGNDTLTGGNGDDTFIFRMGDGSDTITDFAAGGASGDVVQMTSWGASFDTFGEVIAAASQVGADVVFNFGNGQTLTLQNVALGNLNANDFLFA